MLRYQLSLHTVVMATKTKKNLIIYSIVEIAIV